MQIDLTGKKALVTGASRGLGRAIALSLARAGADVVITYEKSADKAQAVADEIKALGRHGEAVQADSASAQAIQDAVTHAARSLGGLDILVNNAGIARGGPLESMTLADIDALINVNIRGVVIATQEALVHMADGGRIINIGSCLANRVAMPGIAVYAMTKSALNALTRGLARDLGPRGITVNLVHPGPTNSDMNPEDGEQAEAQRQMIAVGHYGQPEDIAAAVTFLASRADLRYGAGRGWRIERLIAHFLQASVARQRPSRAASTGCVLPLTCVFLRSTVPHKKFGIYLIVLLFPYILCGRTVEVRMKIVWSKTADKPFSKIDNRYKSRIKSRLEKMDDKASPISDIKKIVLSRKPLPAAIR